LPLTARVLLKNCWAWDGAGESWEELLAVLLELDAALIKAGGWLIVLLLLLFLRVPQSAGPAH